MAGGGGGGGGGEREKERTLVHSSKLISETNVRLKC